MNSYLRVCQCMCTSQWKREKKNELIFSGMRSQSPNCKFSCRVKNVSLQFTGKITVLPSCKSFEIDYLTLPARSFVRKIKSHIYNVAMLLCIDNNHIPWKRLSYWRFHFFSLLFTCCNNYYWYLTLNSNCLQFFTSVLSMLS